MSLITIQDIIQKNPRHYSGMIQKNPELAKWVQLHSTAESDKFIDHIFSACSGTGNRCANGNLKHVKRFSQGWSYCGPASQCQCSRESISRNVSKAKKQYSPEQHAHINQKRCKTMQDKYGVAFNSQRQDIHDIWTRHKIPSEAAELLKSREYLDREYIQAKRSLVDIADELGVYYGTVAEYCREQGIVIRRRSQYSREEIALSKWLTSLGIEHEQGNWSQLQNRELDIWVENRRLAIEINGIFWHSWKPLTDNSEPRNRHLNKTLACNQLNIDLLHITDWQWRHREGQVKNIISSRLGLNRKIGARNCRIQQIDSATHRHFLEQNHLQGWTAASIHLALIHQDKIVMSMSASPNRFSNTQPWEVVRACGAAGITVVGGLSKLSLKMLELAKIDQLTSFCDRATGSGRGYLSAGYVLTRETSPGYFWTDGSSIISRYRSQKSQLKKWLLSFSPDLSESQNMFAAGFRRYWDCGNLVFEYQK